MDALGRNRSAVATIESVENMWDVSNRDDFYFKLPVYNLEVEDFHTYYVGEDGLWVHNQNCGGSKMEASNAQPLAALNDTRLSAEGGFVAGTLVHTKD